MKATWKIIGMVINRKKSSSQLILTKLLYRNKLYTDRTSIANQLNELNNHYINLSNQLAESIPCHNTIPVSYIKRSFQHSFMFRSIDSDEIRDLIMNLKVTTGL